MRSTKWVRFAGTQTGSLLLTMAAVSLAVAHISMASANLALAKSSPNLFLMYRKRRTRYRCRIFSQTSGC